MFFNGVIESGYAQFKEFFSYTMLLYTNKSISQYSRWRDILNHREFKDFQPLVNTIFKSEIYYIFNYPGANVACQLKNNLVVITSPPFIVLILLITLVIAWILAHISTFILDKLQFTILLA